jgi:hypothetical protein
MRILFYILLVWFIVPNLWLLFGFLHSATDREREQPLKQTGPRDARLVGLGRFVLLQTYEEVVAQREEHEHEAERVGIPLLP